MNHQRPEDRSQRYSGPFGRMAELTDIMDRFADALYRDSLAGGTRHEQLHKDFRRVFDARAAEWKRMKHTGIEDREIYRRVTDHRASRGPTRAPGAGERARRRERPPGRSRGSSPGRDDPAR